MKIEEINRLTGFDPKKAWKPEGYDPGYVSDEENEELGRILESMTEDDWKIGMIEVVNRWTGEVKERIYVDD